MCCITAGEDVLNAEDKYQNGNSNLYQIVPHQLFIDILLYTKNKTNLNYLKLINIKH